jgi:hypothetical protein
MTKAHETKVRDPAYEPIEVTITDLTIPIPPSVYNRLAEILLRDMVGSAMATIEWQLSDPQPVVDVCFENLESVRFPLRPMLQISQTDMVIESVIARDGLAEMFEAAAKRLRAMPDEYFEQFYDKTTGRSGTDR